jgi:hypothetical protein
LSPPSELWPESLWSFGSQGPGFSLLSLPLSLPPPPCCEPVWMVMRFEAALVDGVEDFEEELL